MTVYIFPVVRNRRNSFYSDTPTRHDKMAVKP